MSLSSLDDLTRNSFVGGLSSSKVGVLGSGQPSLSPNSATQRALSNSVLVLYRSFPGDPVLQEYLKVALQNGLLSIAIFVSTLLSMARSPELHQPATLDMLCRTALDAHYSSGQSSTDLADYDSPITVLTTLQDALALLRVAHGLPMSHFHQLTTSASELVALLFSCVEISQGPPAQCIALLSDANSMLSHDSISQNVRQALEAFTLSLGLFVGDSEAKASKTTEAPLMHNFHLVVGKNDAMSSNNDTVTFSLTLNYLLTHRAEEFGVGSGSDAARLFVSMFRSNSWAPPVFYTQLLLSAFVCLSETTIISPKLWASFIISRLPSILVTFEKVVYVEGAAPENWRGALQVAVTALMRRADLLERCDRVVDQSAQQDGLAPLRSIFRDLIRQFQHSGLLELQFILAIDPNHTQSDLMSELNDQDGFFSSRLSSEMEFEDARSSIERIWNEPMMHKAFSEFALRRFKAAASSLDTETLSFWARMFYSWDLVLDLLALHQSIGELVFHALVCLQDFDCETVGDPQTGVSQLGHVVLFAQSTLARFHLQNEVFTYGKRQVPARLVRSTAVVYEVAALSGEDSSAFNTWYKAIFDRNSEGIEDTIIRSVKPRTLLKISATLFSSAMRDPEIDNELLNNGVSYFTGSLLNWTLVGVVLNITREISQQGFSPATSKPLHVLRTLLLSPDCPRTIRCLCGQAITTLLADKRSQNTMSPADTTAIVEAVSRASFPNLNSTPAPAASSTAQVLAYPRRAIQDAIANARASKAPSLDVDRCIRICGPAQFLRMLWSELLAPGGDADVNARIATFVVTIPRPFNTPPLMLNFFNTVLPHLIAMIDARQSGDQTVPAELLGSIVCSALLASLHLDLVFTEAPRPVLGQASPSLARRLAADLRARVSRGSNVSKTILQRLSSSPSIVSNFPFFK
ncbi:Mediator of RNA polymerase II transcription subunit 5 [Mycena chlorophos]|uniref:Mediator of RNA polymerase II transcription subunit 5 n=1 Tax=Mycena chlorophos TaxID=658473 RepID=A0A8H6T2P4_MYCCL|nr:Mediator of RNA polymerase II transcription subunit 5 [Mycena chlorophos]